ncbi:MAG: trypsin-like serine protease [Actinobacteria bacterium]|nr:MAG: trypsin-like serine protease [Actinomycetota bacterium]
MLAVATAALALLCPSAGAVQGGTPDGNGHPNVGLSVFLYHGIPLWRCTGTMVAAKVYLTAGHCTGIDTDLGVAPDSAQVWFTSGAIPRGTHGFDGTPCKPTDTGYPCKGEFSGTPVPHPGWNGFLTQPNTHDIGVVQLTQAPNVGLSKVAPAGYLDTLATQRGRQDVDFTIVGYGVQFESPNLEVALRQRFVGTNQLQNLRSHLAGGFNLIMSDSAGNGTGGSGTCFGDSGGPVFHTDSDGQVWQVAVISYGTKYCHGSSAAFRLDNAQARAFLSSQGVPLN